MTILSSPAAEINLENAQATADSIESKVSNIFELIETLEIYYDNQQSRIQTLKNSSQEKTPWKNSVALGPATTVNINDPFDFVFTPPIRDLYYSSSESVNNNNPNFIANYNTGRYDAIYREHKERIDFNNGLKNSINNALSQLKNLNTAGYQTQLEQAKTLISDVMLAEIQVFDKILRLVRNEVTNPQSIIYKPGSPFGPFSQAEIADFDPGFTDIIQSNSNIISSLTNIYNRLDELVNIPEDVLARVSLVNAGLTQSAEDPSQFNLQVPEEKDPWGIRFTYQAQTLGNRFTQGRQLNQFNPQDGSISERNARAREEELFASRSLLEQSTINYTKNFYFQLLPAIKTNMPSSGSTDVPGAMPGIQFRIENNIVKHKIPGFAPVYQPIGIDSIKCTLVGMFSGNDGVDLSSAFSDDISAGLIPLSQKSNSNNFLSNAEYSLHNKPVFQPYNPTNNHFNETNLLNNPRFNIDSSGLPIPSQSKSVTGSNVAILSEDAFRGAQDFYNEIVSQGREVEVELNLRKGTGPFPGGSPGPFRDPETGNPKFKALIKRLDLYYVRRDRCWFIIDLEITDSGLIGKECINLTNVIEESIDIFEQVKTIRNLTKEELDDCFISPIEIPLTGARNGEVFVLDISTGLSYFYNSTTGNLLSDQTFPLSYQATQEFLGQNAKSGIFKNLPFINDIENTFQQLSVTSDRIKVAGLMLKLAALYEPRLSDKERDFSKGWIPSSSVLYVNLHGTAWRYDKNIGKFIYVYGGNGEIVRSAETANSRAKSLKELLYERQIGFYDPRSLDKIINFVINEYNPLLEIPENNCQRLLDQLAEEATTPPNKPINGTGDVINAPAKQTPDTVDQSVSAPNLSPVDVLSPEQLDGTKNENQELEVARESVENGALNALLQQGINEYLKVLEPNNSSFYPTSLSPAFTSNLKSLVQSGDLIVTKRVSVTLQQGKTRLVREGSNKSALIVGVEFKNDDTIKLKAQNQELALIDLGNRRADVIIKAYINNDTNIKEYKIDGVRIKDVKKFTPDLEPATVAPKASNNLEPSSNNPPSTN